MKGKKKKKREWKKRRGRFRKEQDNVCFCRAF
jgi:hypothetical protein